MSLHCPATLYVARHGDAQYALSRPDGRRMLSDEGGRLTTKGEEQVTALAESLCAERIASVCCSDLSRARDSAEVAARVLGVGVRVLPGLGEIGVGDCAGLPYADPCYQGPMEAWLDGRLDERVPGGEDGHEVLARYTSAIEEVADLHRGESVLVISHGAVMAYALPRLASNLRDEYARERYLPNAVPVRMSAGAAGVVIEDWPGHEDRTVV